MPLGYIDPVTGEWVADVAAGDPYAPVSNDLGLPQIEMRPQPPQAQLEPPRVEVPLAIAQPSQGIEQQGGDASVGMSYSGLDRPALEQYFSPTGMGSRKEREIFDAANSSAVAKFSPLMQQNRAAGEAAIRATQETGQAQLEGQAAIAGGYANIAKMYEDRASEDKIRFAEQTEKEKNATVETKRAAWEATRAKWAGMRVKPRAYTTGESVASGIEAWLSLWGHKVNFNQTIQNNIRNDIDAQIQNIQHGKEVTAEFRAAYDDAVRDAKSAAEVKEKLYGIQLNGMVARNNETMAMAKSKNELAAAKERGAALNQALVKNEADIVNMMTSAANAEANQRIQLYNIGVDANMARQELALKQRAYDDSQRPVAKLPEASAMLRHPWTGEPYWVMEGGNEKTYNDVLTSWSTLKELTPELTEYVDLMHKYKVNPEILDKVSGGHLRGLSSETASRAQELLARLEVLASKTAKALDPEGAITPGATMEARRIILKDTWATRGSPDKALAALQDSLLNKALSKASIAGRPLSEDERVYFKQGGSPGKAFSVTSKSIDAMRNPEAYQEEDSDVDGLTRNINRSVGTKKGSPEWKEFVKHQQNADEITVGTNKEGLLTTLRGVNPLDYSGEEEPVFVDEVKKLAHKYETATTPEDKARFGEGLRLLSKDSGPARPFARWLIKEVYPEVLLQGSGEPAHLTPEQEQHLYNLRAKAMR